MLLLKLKIELPYDPAISGYLFKENINTNSKDICTRLFIVVSFTVAKIQMQPKCSPTDEWIKKMWYTYNRILFDHQKECNSAVCNNVDGPREYYAQQSKTEKDKYYHLYVESKKIKQTNVYNKTETDVQVQRTNQWLPMGRGKQRVVRWGRGLRGTNYYV